MVSLKLLPASFSLLLFNSGVFVFRNSFSFIDVKWRTSKPMVCTSKRISLNALVPS
jgi:hypothetical protein